MISLKRAIKKVSTVTAMLTAPAIVVAFVGFCIFSHVSFREHVADLTDTTVDTRSHFELNLYVKTNYQGCYNKMYSHLKWPHKFDRPECEKGA